MSNNMRWSESIGEERESVSEGAKLSALGAAVEDVGLTTAVLRAEREREREQLRQEREQWEAAVGHTA